MKIALCLSGYFDSLKDSSSRGMDGFEYIKKHILSHGSEDCEIDVFFHNWEPHLEEKLVDLYKPRKHIIEPQIDFVPIAQEHEVSREDIDPYNFLGNWTMTSTSGTGYVGPERLLSQYYSLSQSLVLKREYEKEQGFKYDCVIKARFDLGRINRATSGPGKQNPFPCQCINFDPTLDMNYLYQADWDLFNEGPADMWFYSNSKNMDIFCSLYEKVLLDYLQLRSEYRETVTSGWPESKMNDFRSNEKTKPPEERSKNLHKYPYYLAVNGILLMKWFLIKNELWDSAIALQTEWE